MIITSRCETLKVKEINDTLRLITFKIEKFRKFEPGMFLQLTLDDFDPSQPWPESRAFSFASYDNGTESILVRKQGAYTSRIFNEIKSGSEFYIKYPFGEFILSEKSKKVFIAGGAGISVFMSYFDYIKSMNTNEKIILFHSVKEKAELLENYYQLPSNVKNFSFVTKGKYEGFNRRIEMNDILTQLEGDDYTFYICGGDEFIQNYSSGLKSAGFNRIKVENWNNTIN